MRILYITTSLPFSWGREVFFIPEVSGLLRAGCQLRILPRNRGNGDIAKDSEQFVPISELDSLLSLRVLAAAVAEFARSPGSVFRVLRTVLSHGKLESRIKNLAVFPKGLLAGRIARQWGADHIHAQWAATTATIAFVAHGTSHVPWSFSAHRWDIVEGNLLKEKTASASFVRLISHSGLELITQVAPASDRSKYRVIHMGVAVPSCASLPTRGHQGSPFTILCPANLLAVKGHEHLVTAVALVKSRGYECRLIVAGQGPERARIEALAGNLNVGGDVVFLGQVPHCEIITRYRLGAVDAVVLPSVDLGGGLHEGIPVALMEAMAHGIPVVSTATGGIPELVTPGTGILVPPADPHALAQGIVSLMDDAALCRRLGEAGRRKISEEFDAATIAIQLAAEMAEVTDVHPAGPVPGRKRGRHDSRRELRDG